MINILLKKYYHFITLPLGIAVILLGYFFIERTVEPIYKINIFIDDLIPSVDWFIYIYLFWYVYMACGIIYLGICSRKQYYRLGLLLLIGIYVCYFFYLLFPNYIDIRTPVICQGITGSILRWLQSVDNSSNVFPSIHVFATVTMFTAIHMWKKSQKKAWDFFDVLSATLMVLICVSTVFIKQHSILDVISGCLYSSIVWSSFKPRRVVKIILVLDSLIKKAVFRTELV